MTPDDDRRLAFVDRESLRASTCSGDDSAGAALDAFVESVMGMRSDPAIGDGKASAGGPIGGVPERSATPRA
jgi:hypothetical protein